MGKLLDNLGGLEKYFSLNKKINFLVLDVRFEMINRCLLLMGIRFFFFFGCV